MKRTTEAKGMMEKGKMSKKIRKNIERKRINSHERPL
jgi:hypothetical protein